MTVVRVLLQVILLGLASLGISTLMEWYKKTVRKDQAGVWEIRIVAGVASCVAAVLFKVCGVFTPVISAIWPAVTPWLDVVLYAVVIYLFQLYGDMQIVKNVIKYVTDRLLDKNKLPEEIKNMIQEFESTTGFDVKEIAQALALTGLTEEKVIKAIEQIGLSEEKTAELVEAYKQAVLDKLAKEEVKEIENH